MRSTLLVINQGLFFLDINCWRHYFKKINLAVLWQRTWKKKKAWRIFRAYFSAETEINLFSSDGVQHICCENRRTQSLNSEAQCWKCEGVGHMTFINGNISAYNILKYWLNDSWPEVTSAEYFLSLTMTFALEAKDHRFDLVRRHKFLWDCIRKGIQCKLLNETCRATCCSKGLLQQV